MIYNPKVSVVTPSYNQGKFIEQTINSVLNQTYANIEYIIIDGGSTDNTISIINKYTKRLAYWISEKDEGCADALNKGLMKCTGDIFFYINSDDYIFPDTIEKVVKFIYKNPGYNIYYGHGTCLDEFKHLEYKIYSSFWDPLSYTLKRCVLVQQSTFFLFKSKDKTPVFNIINKTCWDSEFLIDLTKEGYSFCRMPFDYVISTFRVHSNSITGSQSQVDQYFIDQKRLQQKVKAFISKSKIIEVFKIKYAFYFLDFQLYFLRLRSKVFIFIKENIG